MTIQSFTLDPNAQIYSDNDIVDKINAASNAITRSDAISGAALGNCDLDDLSDGSTNKGYTGTEQSKLAGIEDNATADQTGAEVRDLLSGLSDTERLFVMTDPESGEYPVIAIERKSDGKLNVKYDDVAV